MTGENCKKQFLKSAALMLFIFEGFNKAGGAMYAQDVYIQPLTIEQHLYMRPLPALTDFTFCCWLNMAHGGGSQSYLVSIAAPANDNHYLWGWTRLKTSDRKMVLHTNSSGRIFRAITEDEETKLFTGWHRHCVVNKHLGTDQYSKWFMDLNEPGVLVEMGTVSEASSMDEGNSLVLMQEQDSYGGGFNAQQILAGKLAMFNMWNYTMNLTELTNLGCHSKGNVVTMDELKYEGPEELLLIKQDFPCPDVPGKVLPREGDNMMFCQLTHKSLMDAVLISTNHAVKLADCAKHCAFNAECKSANFYKETSSCELIGVSLAEAPDLLQDAPGSVHLSSVACA